MHLALGLPELVEHILEYIDCGSDYKSVRAVSIAFRAAAMTVHPRGHLVFANHLATLLKIFPNRAWNPWEIAENPNATWDILSRMCGDHSLDDVSMVSCNPIITPDIVAANTDFAWDRRGLSENPSQMDAFAKCPRTDHWDIEGISANASIPWDVVIAYPHWPWNPTEMSCNPSVTIGIVELSPHIEWNWDGLSSILRLTDDLLSAYADKLTHGGMSRNTSVTPAIIQRYYGNGKKWNWFRLAANSAITPAIIDDNPEWPWSLAGIAGNPNITWEWISTRTNINSMCAILSRNPAITMQIVLDHPEYPWDNNALSENPNITYEDVVTCADISWNYTKLSANRFGK